MEDKKSTNEKTLFLNMHTIKHSCKIYCSEKIAAVVFDLRA